MVKTLSAAAAVAGMVFAVPALASGACPDLLPATVAVPAQARAITTLELLRLREIGQPDPSVGGPSPIALSPDGKQLAMVVSRADPVRNSVCQGLLVLNATATGATLLDSGGEFIRAENVVRTSRTPAGLPATVTPVWSPDGRSLAYLKRVEGRTQVWLVAADGGAATVISAAPVDVESVAWSADGERLIYTTRPGRIAFAAAAQAEGRIGYLYDGRMLPPNGPAPQLPADLPRAFWSMPRTGGSAVSATAADAARIGDVAELSLPYPLAAQSADGRAAGADRIGPSPYAPRQVWASDRRGVRIGCAATVCTGPIRATWWQPDGRALLFLRYEGWNNEFTALYRWVLGSGVPRRLLRTEAALVGCTLGPAQFFCLSETSLSPRRLVSIGLRDGKMRKVFDPNPEFDAIARPHVERLRWRNAAGLPAWGDLVLPAGRPPTRGWPLVIVQYTSRGFLRGGTGDEYPVLPFAAHGLAVLSLQRPPLLVEAQPELADTDAVVAAVLKGWAERRNTHASLEAGLARVFARGDIDRDRVGITGLSDGATTARYALIAGMRFRAAALSTCCRYQRADLIYGGTVLADGMQKMGFPSSTAQNETFWEPLSLPRAAARLTTPLLMQVADEEALFALETFTAFREQHIPVELRTFPDESHIKWQPAHRAAIYERNLDWFRFWLAGDEDRDASKADQYRRWREWRDRPAKSGAGSGP